MKLIRFTLLSAAALALVSCGPKQEEVQGETVRNEVVKVEPLQKSEISRVVEFSTNLQGYETMSIAPSVTGKIEEIFVEVQNIPAASRKLSGPEREIFPLFRINLSLF